jgi:hypothetical protein
MSQFQICSIGVKVTLKPRFNKSEWTIDFVLHSRVSLLEGLFIMKSTTKGFKIMFLIARILSLKWSIFRGFNVLNCFNAVPIANLFR